MSPRHQGAQLPHVSHPILLTTTEEHTSQIPMPLPSPPGQPHPPGNMKHKPQIPLHDLLRPSPLHIPLPLPRLICLSMRHKPLLKTQSTLDQIPHQTFIPALHNPNQLRRHRAMIIRHTYCIARHSPLLTKDTKIYLAYSGPFTRRCEDAESSWVELV